MYRLICLMNHQNTHQTNLITPWEPRPHWTWTPKQSLNLIGPSRSTGLPYKSSEDPSNVGVDPMEHPDPPSPPFTLWDPLGLPPDPLGPCRPAP